MKKLLFACVATVFILLACDSKENKATEQATTSNDQSEKNLASARAVADAFKTGNTAAIDSVVADNFLDHTDRGDMVGRDSLKAMITWLHKNPHDMKMETIQEVADGEYVYQWMRYTGTSDGSMGPKGPYDMQVIELSKHKDGKIVEHWAFMDARDMGKMMAAMQPQPADTAKAKK